MSNEGLRILLIVGGAFVLFALIMFTAGSAKIKKDVILELQRSYVPGPYAPGYDPDKINPRFQRN